jgi:hypothetical protein
VPRDFVTHRPAEKSRKNLVDAAASDWNNALMKTARQTVVLPQITKPAETMIMRILRHVSACALIVVPAAQGTIISGPVISPVNGHIYYLLDTATWTSSEQEAITLGGHLATVRSDAENMFLISTFANFGGQPRDLWIGLNDVAEEGTFVWVSGEPFSYVPAGSALNTDLGGEDYVHIIKPGLSDSGAWNDFPDAAYPTRPTYGVVEIPELSSAFFLLTGATFCSIVPLGKLKKYKGEQHHPTARARRLLRMRTHGRPAFLDCGG